MQKPVFSAFHGTVENVLVSFFKSRRRPSDDLWLQECAWQLGLCPLCRGHWTQPLVSVEDSCMPLLSPEASSRQAPLPAVSGMRFWTRTSRRTSRSTSTRNNELSNEHSVVKIGFDTTESEPCEVCPLSTYRSSKPGLLLCELSFGPGIIIINFADPPGLLYSRKCC